MSDVIGNRLPATESGIPEAASEAAKKVRIVVGVSGSPASALALRWAAAQADRLFATLAVVLVRTTEPRANYAPAISADELERRQQRVVADLAATVGVVTRDLPSDAVTTTVVEGVAERVLIEQSAGADLLVLGSAAAVGGDGPIGPVVRACLSRAHCPLVVVGPPEPTGHSRPGAAVSRSQPVGARRVRHLAGAASAPANGANGGRRSS